MTRGKTRKANWPSARSDDVLQCEFSTRRRAQQELTLGPPKTVVTDNLTLPFRPQFRTGERPKEKPSFMRRMTTFGRGATDRPRMAMMDVAFISTALGGNIKSLVTGDGKDGVLRKACHESVRKHVEQIYDNLRGRDKKLPRRKFLNFLKNTQGLVTIEQLEAEEFTFQEFFFYWLKHEDAWRAARELRPHEVDQTKPISNYYISSSHNTYLEGNQLSSKSSAEAYTAVRVLLS